MQLFDTHRHTHIHTSNWSADWHWFSHDCKGVLGDSWEPSLCESSKWLGDAPSSLNRSTVSLIFCEVFDALKEWMRETCPSQILRQLLHVFALPFPDLYLFMNWYAQCWQSWGLLVPAVFFMSFVRAPAFSSVSRSSCPLCGLCPVRAKHSTGRPRFDAVLFQRYQSSAQP